MTSTLSSQQPGTKYQGPGTKDQVPGTSYQVPSTKYEVPSTRYQVASTRYRVPSTEYQVPNTKYQILGCWLLVVGCWLLVVGCCLLLVACCLLVGGGGAWPTTNNTQHSKSTKMTCKYDSSYFFSWGGGGRWIPQFMGACMVQDLGGQRSLYSWKSVNSQKINK